MFGLLVNTNNRHETKIPLVALWEMYDPALGTQSQDILPSAGSLVFSCLKLFLTRTPALWTQDTKLGRVPL